MKGRVGGYVGRRWAWRADGWAEGAVDMEAVCMVGVDVSAGMSNKIEKRNIKYFKKRKETTTGAMRATTDLRSDGHSRPVLSYPVVSQPSA